MLMRCDEKPWGAMRAGWGEALRMRPLAFAVGDSQYRFRPAACTAASSIQIPSNSVFLALPPLSVNSRALPMPRTPRSKCGMGTAWPLPPGIDIQVRGHLAQATTAADRPQRSLAKARCLPSPRGLSAAPRLLVICLRPAGRSLSFDGWR